MTPELERRAKEAFHKADDAFWAEVAKAFPEAGSGDLPPDIVFAFDETGQRAVREWVYWNVATEEEREAGDP